MKKMFLNWALNLVKQTYPNYDHDKLDIINYGLESMYLTISKMIIIFLSAYLLGIFKEMFIFLIIYNIPRATAFGLHASKTWMCLISSLLIFIGLPIICKTIAIPIFIKLLIFIGCGILFFRYAPADTVKRPIVNQKRRMIYKAISLIICVLYALISLTTNNNFLSNALLFGLLVELSLIIPITYKIFKLPYNNYLSYIAMNHN